MPSSIFFANACNNLMIKIISICRVLHDLLEFLIVMRKENTENKVGLLIRLRDSDVYPVVHDRTG